MEKYSLESFLQFEVEEEEKEVGTSLFHQFLAQRTFLHYEEDRTFLLHRLIVVASLPQQPEDRRNLGEYYEELNLRLQKQHQGDTITGLLLIYPTCLLHVIESSSEVLVSLLQDLNNMQERTDCVLVEAATILLMSHDLPRRLFQQWSHKVLNIQATTLGDESEEGTTESLVSTVLSLLLKLGNHPDIIVKPETSPGSVLDEAPELIVPQEVLVQLLSREELLSPQQYLHTYHSPLNIRMDSEYMFGLHQKAPRLRLSYSPLGKRNRCDTTGRLYTRT